jgi:3-oxoacyl-[acyl-carrier protein] reductase
VSTDAQQDEFRFEKRITTEEIEAFAKLSGDYNPLHLNADFARARGFKQPVAHGILLAGFVSRMVGMQVPGAGALWMRQAFQWPAPVFAGDDIQFVIRIKHRSLGSGMMTIEVTATNQDGKSVMSGEGAVTLPEPQPERPMGVSLKETVAILTGGAANAGAAIARELARGGASIAFIGTSAENEAAAAGILQEGGQAIVSAFDIAGIEKHLGRPVGVLVNNTTQPVSARPFSAMTWEDAQSALDAELRIVFESCQAVLPGMIERKSGVILNLGSVLTRQTPGPQSVANVMAKSALLGLTRALAAEVGPQGVRVNMISLGELAGSGETSDRLRKLQAMQTPLRRLVTHEDVAQTVAFLCSDAAAFLTGTDLPLSGGAHI